MISYVHNPLTATTFYLLFSKNMWVKQVGYTQGHKES